MPAGETTYPAFVFAAPSLVADSFDEEGRLKSGKLPAEIDARLIPLNGSFAGIADAAEGELAVESSDPLQPLLMTRTSAGVFPAGFRVAPGENPYGVAEVVASTASTWTLSACTSNGYLAVEWWDGTKQLLGSGDPDAVITASKSGGADATPRGVRFWIPTSGSNWMPDLDQSVHGLSLPSFTFLVNLSGIKFSPSATAASKVLVASGWFRHLHLDGDPSEVVTINIDSPYLETLLDLSGFTSATEISLQASGSVALPIMPAAAGVSVFRLSDHARATGVLDLTPFGAASFSTFTVADNPGLTEIQIAAGVVIDSATYWAYSVNLQNNGLSAAALNNFFDALGNCPQTYGPVTIYIAGNPGASDPDLDASLATGKGYNVST